jgi:hypothetical protein
LLLFCRGCLCCDHHCTCHGVVGGWDNGSSSLGKESRESQAIAVWHAVTNIIKMRKKWKKIRKKLAPFLDIEHCSNTNRTFRTWTFCSCSCSPPARTEPQCACLGSGLRPPTTNGTEPQPV